MYKKIKASLNAEGINTRYLNKAFYNLFLDCKKAGDFTPVKNTKLYQLNGTTYCRFLEYAAEA